MIKLNDFEKWQKACFCALMRRKAVTRNKESHEERPIMEHAPDTFKLALTTLLRNRRVLSYIKLIIPGV